MNKSDFLACLIRTACFPRELPPSFTTKYFADFCKNDFTSVMGQSASLAKLNTQYDTFTMPRNRKKRRNLAIVHPLGQLAVSTILTQNKYKISKLISSDDSSLYSTTENKKENLAFQGLNFDLWRRNKNILYSEHPVVLKADISRFFYTIYTHSIPWAVFGKDKAKKLYFAKDKSFQKHWSNQLDKAVQSCQSRETFGIPVGPDTSRMIAELLLSSISKELQFPKNGLTVNRLRLVDDLLVGFNSAEEAKELLLQLRSKFWAFNLQLNDEKTAVVDSRLEFTPAWEHELDDLYVHNTNASVQRRQIIKLVDFALAITANHNDSSAAKLAAVRIGHCQPFDENFSIALDAMFRLARDYSDCTGLLVEFLINTQDDVKKLSLVERVERGLKKLVAFHSQRNHDYEVVWCLLASCPFEIKWNSTDITMNGGLPQPTTLAMLGLMNERKLLNFKLSSLNWRTRVKALGPMSSYWLPYYEAVGRKWTKDTGMRNAIKSHPILDQMLSAKVTFLEDSVLKATKINLKKRLFNFQKKKMNFSWTMFLDTDY